VKYRNVKTGGFDSKKEAKRHGELVLMEKLGLIRELETQVRYEIVPKVAKNRPAHYIADFVYWEGDQHVVEDCKGFRTPEYKLKKKLMLWRHGIEIRET